MLSRLFQAAGVTVAAATGTVLIGKGYQQNFSSKNITGGSPRVHATDGSCSLEEIKDAARELILRRKEECGAPGVTIAVNKNGRPLWSEGFGYADVENMAPMTPLHVLRIASISKPITMALVGRAVDEGRLDVLETVHHYLPHYPRHIVDGEQVHMTTDQLATHRAGIRHYQKKPEVDELKKNIANSKKNKLAHEILAEAEYNELVSSVPDSAPNEVRSGDQVNEKPKNALVSLDDKEKEDTEKTDKNETGKKLPEIKPAIEFHTTTKFETVGEALNVFMNDELLHKPGSDFHYSTHGFTLISAVLEAATKTKFPTLLREMFEAMDLRCTYVDENEPIIRNRAKYYVREGAGRLQNAPHVDNSWKVAGGGLLSTPSDLCRFADTMLYSWQADAAASPAGYLRPQTARWLWTAPEELPAGRRRRSPLQYARGWQVRQRAAQLGAGPAGALVACHTGGAAGCSSVLLVRPAGTQCGADGRPRGVTVAIIVNTEGANMTALADDIAGLFAD